MGIRLAAAELILAEDRKRHFYRDRGREKSKMAIVDSGNELTGMGVVVSALLGLLETCLIFLGLRLLFIYSGIFSSGSVGVSVDF
ncbi:MAG: hypothetical protein ACLTSZ_09080 [Lachnospiraceae bacterium]